MTSESSRLHTPVSLERRAWFQRTGDLVRLVLARTHQAWLWSRPRLIAAGAATIRFSRRGARRVRLGARALGRRVMAVVNAFDARWERTRRRTPRRAVPSPPPAAAKPAPGPAPILPRVATSRPTTSSVGRAIARPGAGTTAKLGTPALKGPSTGGIAKPAASVDTRRAAGKPAALQCWSCSAVTEVTGARRGGCYYCSRCGKLMTALNLATGRTRAFTGRNEISPDETEPGDD